MAQYKIQASVAVPGMFEGVDESGKLFFEGKAYYDSKRGLKQAISKSKNGHTYVDPEAEAKAKAKPAKEADLETRDTIPAPPPVKYTLTDPDDILATFEECKRVALKDPENPDWASANRIAKDAGFPHFKVLSRVVKGIRHSRKDPATRAKHEAKAAERKARKVEKVETKKVAAGPDMGAGWDRFAANKCARLHGFEKYRAVNRAADRGDTTAMLVRELCIRVATGRAALPESPVVVRPNQKTA